jgi:hypothetical protein
MNSLGVAVNDTLARNRVRACDRSLCLLLNRASRRRPPRTGVRAERLLQTTSTLMDWRRGDIDFGSSTRRTPLL